MRKRIKILLILLMLLILSLVMKNDKVYGYYVGQTMNINYTDLTQYQAGNPFTCTQEGQASLCGRGTHIFKCTSKSAGKTTTSGTTASISVDGNSAEWSEYSDSEIKIGPYNVTYAGNLKEIIIDTDQGQFVKNLQTGTVTSAIDGFRVGDIVNNSQFYIYISKNSKVTKITGGKISVESEVNVTTKYTYIWKCISVSGSHMSNDGTHEWNCNVASNVQILSSKEYDSSTTLTTDSDTIPESLPRLTDLIVHKKDKYGDNENFTGTKFALYDESGNLIEEKAVNSEGKAIFEDLEFKKYVVKETAIASSGVATSNGYAMFDGVKYNLNNIQVDLTNKQNAQSIINGITVEVFNETYFKFAGRVFVDEKNSKTCTSEGYLDEKDTLLENIIVRLFKKNGTEISTTRTDTNGYFEFGYQYKLSKEEEYYLRFEYNGQLYEPTTYRLNGGDIEKVSKVTEGRNTSDTNMREYVEKMKENRILYNNVYANIPTENILDDTIYAYTGSNGKYSLEYYSINKSKEDRENINLGLLKRPEFDLAVTKDSVEFRLTVNNVPTVYEFDTLEKNRNDADEALEVELKGADLNPYTRYLRKSDLLHMKNNEDLSKMEIVYKIKVVNESDGYVTGLVNVLRDWYDKALILKEIKIGGKQVGTDKYSIVEDTKSKYNYIDIYQEALVAGEIRNIEMTFTINIPMLSNQMIYSTGEITDLAKNGLVKNNFVEIRSYSTYYTNEEKDLNGNIRHGAGYSAGLIDIDSTPGNFDPEDEELQEFINDCDSDNPTYPAFEEDGSPGIERRKKTKELFEDDADRSPGLKLKVSNSERSIEGIVFVDGANTAQLEAKNERIGDGHYNTETPAYSEADLPAKGVIVSLWEIVGLNDAQYNDQNRMNNNEEGLDNPTLEGEGNNDRLIKSTVSGDDGKYIIEEFVPGKYYLTFTYGTLATGDGQPGTLQNEENKYNGQDYKSTDFQHEAHEENYILDGDKVYKRSWWYVLKNEEDEKIYLAGKPSVRESYKLSAARDSWSRRNEINDNCKEINNYTGESLNGDIDLGYLQGLTSMTADTNRLDIEVDYPAFSKSPDEIEYQSEINNLKINTEQTTSEYKIKNINFGIIERPRNEIFLEEKVTKVVITSDQRSPEVSNVLVNAEGPVANVVAWTPNTYDQKTRTRNVGIISATLDDSLRQGSTIYIHYEIKATNKGEVNYVHKAGDNYIGMHPFEEGDEIQLYYYRGYKPINVGRVAETSTGDIINYLSDDLTLMEGLNYNKDNEGNPLWKVVTDKELNEIYYKSSDSKNSLINNKITGIKESNILAATEYNGLANKSLKPGTKALENGESVTTTLVVTQQLTSIGDQGPFEDITEVIKQKSDAGRRCYAIAKKDGTMNESAVTRKETGKLVPSIPGNLDPILAYDPSGANIRGPEEAKQQYITRFGSINESDSALSEPADVIPPFGSKRDYTKMILIGVSVMVMLGVGIYFIKKKVL